MLTTRGEVKSNRPTINSYQCWKHSMMLQGRRSRASFTSGSSGEFSMTHSLCLKASSSPQRTCIYQNGLCLQHTDMRTHTLTLQRRCSCGRVIKSPPSLLLPHSPFHSCHWRWSSARVKLTVARTMGAFRSSSSMLENI